MLLLRFFSFQAQEVSPIGVLTYKIWSRLFAYQASLCRNSFGTKAYARSRGSTSQNGHGAPVTQDFNLCDFFFPPVPSVESPIHKNNAGPQAWNSPSSPQMPILPTTLVLSQGSVYLLKAPINKNCHHNNFTAFTTTMGLAAKQCSSYKFLMAVSHLIHDLHHRWSTLINKLNKVKQHISKNEDTILVIHHSLTSSSDTYVKANLAGLLIHLCTRWSALIWEQISIKHHIKESDDSLEVILLLPLSHGLQPLLKVQV